MAYLMVYSTAGSEAEAGKIAKALVKEKLAACVNYFPAKSVYWWEGKLAEESEHILLCKTTSKKYAKLEKRIKELHSYDCPPIIAYNAHAGSKEYLSWINENTQM